MKPAIFLDRDGVIGVNRPEYVRSWDEFEFLPGVLEAMKRLRLLGWPVVVISNQSAIGQGLVRIEDVDDINARMVSEVEAAGGHVEGIYFCPHRPDEECACRKPEPGMLTQAAKELDLDLAGSYLIGDAKSDVQAALAVGASAILVLTGRGVDQLETMVNFNGKFRVAKDLLEAVTVIEMDIGRTKSHE